jgi:CheY-like chemotaxis protein
VSRTVLIVDDSPTIRGFAKLFLKAMQMDVAEAEEGAKALELLRSVVPVLAIVDVNMPGMDGLAFTRAVRADSRPEIAQLPIVLLTGDKSAELREQGRAAGANDFLGKPIKGPELQAMVKKLVESAK